jgi:hypothetical protein
MYILSITAACVVPYCLACAESAFLMLAHYLHDIDSNMLTRMRFPLLLALLSCHRDDTGAQKAPSSRCRVLPYDDSKLKESLAWKYSAESAIARGKAGSNLESYWLSIRCSQVS